MASSMTNVTGSVAAGLIFPVEVFIKSAPAAMAISLANLTLSKFPSSPVSKITFSLTDVPHACLIAAISSYTNPKSPM